MAKKKKNKETKLVQESKLFNKPVETKSDPETLSVGLGIGGVL